MNPGTIRYTLRIAASIGVAMLVSACATGPQASSSDRHYEPAISSVTVLKTGTTSAGQTIPYLRTNQPEVTGLLVTIPPGKQTGWHHHTCPGYAYVLEGELIVESEDGKENRYRPGDAFAEMVGKGHNGRNRGARPVRLIAFFTGEKDKPITVKNR